MPYSGGAGILTTVSSVLAPDAIFGANLMLWLEAADASLVDRTSNHNNFQQNVGEPFFTTTDFNGKPGYQTTGTFGRGMSSAGGYNADGFPVIGTAGAIFCTLRIDTSSSIFPRIFSFAWSPVNDDDNVNSIAMGCNDSGAQPNVGGLFNSTGNTPSPNFNFGTYHRVGVVWNSTTVWTYFDNVATDAGVAASMNVSGGGSNPFSAAFGAAKNGGNNLKGGMGDALVVNVTPTTTQLNQLDAYFRNRFTI